MKTALLTIITLSSGLLLSPFSIAVTDRHCPTPPDSGFNLCNISGFISQDLNCKTTIKNINNFRFLSPTPKCGQGSPVSIVNATKSARMEYIVKSGDGQTTCKSIFRWEPGDDDFSAILLRNEANKEKCTLCRYQKFVYTINITPKEQEDPCSPNP